MTLKTKIGNFGQQIAGQFLLARNYTIKQENYYSRFGEIDIIAEKNNQLVFIEVKTRLSDQFGLPEEAFDQSKRARLEQTIAHYLAEQSVNHDNWRLDCLAVEIDKQQKIARIRHHKNTS